MKRNYFLISVLIAFIAPSLISGFSILKNPDTYDTIESAAEINIPSENYLNLSYQNGTFYSWNQIDSNDQHVIGVFSSDDQSYLLDSFGVFWSLDYQISKFYRITDEYGIAQVKYFQDENKNEYVDRTFVVKLANNKLTITSSVILSENTTFTILSKNYVVASGLGLDLIQIDDQGTVTNVSNLIPAYNKGNFLTSFYAINADSGIFVDGDQYFYLLKNITSTVAATQINFKAPFKNGNNIVVINSANLLIRDIDNTLHVINSSDGSVVNSWPSDKIWSKADNFAFALSDDTFILNTSFNNSGIEGKPYLIKTSDWSNLIEIPNIKSITNFIFTDKDSSKGIFIDKDLNANNFVYQNDSFTINNFGTLNNFQFVSKNLIFSSVQSNNLLIAQDSNQTWAATKSIKFTTNSTNTSGNLLNSMIVAKEEEINYQNTYFANGSANISVTDEKLTEVIIETDAGTRRLEPTKNSVTYDFLNFDKYKVTVKFFSDDVTYQIVYQVNIVNFANKEMLNISGSNLKSYVGSSQDILYDIKSIDRQNIFNVDEYDYNFLQYVELLSYGDTNDMVVKNIYNLQNNSEIKVSTIDPDWFFGLKIVNLVNQVSWIYLGFSHDGVNPMIDFWDTDKGKDLMDQALMHRYLERDLRKLSSLQINQLLITSNNWYSIAVQGKAIVISIISIFGISIIAICAAGIYNITLNKKIAIDQVERNKILKNTIDL